MPCSGCLAWNKSQSKKKLSESKHWVLATLKQMEFLGARNYFGWLKSLTKSCSFKFRMAIIEKKSISVEKWVGVSFLSSQEIVLH